MIDFIVIGADHVEHSLFRVAELLPAAGREALLAGAEVVKRNMVDTSEAGRPGPIGRSHTNRDSIEISEGVGLDGAEIRVGPTSPYGRRLELGFHGSDSLGRHYDVDGFPYVQPAEERSMDEVAAVVEVAYAAALASALEA